MLPWQDATAEWLLLLCYGLIVLRLLPYGYQRLRHDQGLQSRTVSASFLLFGLWQLQAGIYPQLQLHLLAVTCLTLCFGYRLALLISAFSTFWGVLFGLTPWLQVGHYWLFDSLVPISASYLLFAYCYHQLPRHFFVYIFVCAFLNAGLSICLQLTGHSLSSWLLGYYAWDIISDNYWQLALLLWFPEASLNGMLMTILVVYRPQWVSTFFDRDYLQR